MKMEFSFSVSWCDYFFNWYTNPSIASSVEEICRKIKEMMPHGHYQDFEFEGSWVNDDGTEYDDTEYRFRIKPIPGIRLIDDKWFFAKLKCTLEEIFKEMPQT